ncbi:aminoacyl-histidine dipeptidase [Peptostreptococcus canis]|uniref:Aminoacyl-histidine dipeptidase n=1 Tax=Peptostreptococcus canis TaxID=1159213 RepID=A0ABR6TLI0_9FIRM|nr:aminoacyl-histidine dipeptidase [Peptostreptococcus canis]MBC2576255.1 aminoacyl-histidine dipeptidase [Peptostreptococcus canis]MBP1998209.1 dipeptidase D [Peptostreptococcus canis]
MKYITEGIYPERVFKNFENISSIPRGSGNEKEISDYIMSFAKSLGLETIQDEYYNLIVKKAATNGNIDGPTVMLQAHVDMVTEAVDGSHHDFTRDPIEIIIEENKMRANNTTLGADDGIGVAYIMAILESNDIIHPNLECVFTTNEEIGLVGVGKMDLSGLKANYVINLDSEEEDFILVGSAGSIDTTISLKKEYKPAVPTNIALEINVKGLFGGHSGMDIDKQRGNSNVIMGRILNSITHEFDLFNISGGSKRNVIPRNSEAVLSVNPEHLENIVREIQKTTAKIQKEIYAVDPGLKVELRRSAPADFKVYTDDCKKRIIGLLTFIPNGVISFSNKIPGTVETSSNFALVRETYNKIDFTSLTRSSLQSQKEYVTSKLKLLANTFNAEFNSDSEYPAWEHNTNSQFEELSVKIYENIFGKKPGVVVMHCGLESGILLSKLNHKAEAISIGPNTFNVHTPEEYVEISSIAKMWDFLIEILKNI